MGIPNLLLISIFWSILDFLVWLQLCKVILLFFKQYNDIPMSTTWVFIGLLCGRELAISTIMQDYKFKYVFPIIAKDFIKMVVGLVVSIGIVLIIHYIIVPNGL